MANNLRVFNTNSEYQSADLVHPAVSYVIETDKVHYEPTTPTPSFKWKAIYQDGHITSAECGSSSEIVKNEIYKNNLVSVEIGDCVTSIGSYVFYYCSGLTSCTIGSGVTSIGNGAFRECSSLTSINIPNSITSIGDGSFQQCTSLANIVFSDSVTSIGDGSFQNCAFSNLIIPSGVTYIGGYAFNGCKSLNSVIVNATTPPILGTNAFYDNAIFRQFYVPSASVDAYKSAWSQYAGRIQPIP